MKTNLRSKVFDRSMWVKTDSWIFRKKGILNLLAIVVSVLAFSSCDPLLVDEQLTHGWTPSTAFSGSNGTGIFNISPTGDGSHTTAQLSRSVSHAITNVPQGVSVISAHAFGSPYTTATYLAIGIRNTSSTPIGNIELNNLMLRDLHGNSLLSGHKSTILFGSTGQIGENLFISNGLGSGETAYFLYIDTSVMYSAVSSVSANVSVTPITMGEPSGSIQVVNFRYDQDVVSSLHDAEIVIRNTGTTTITTRSVWALLFDSDGVPISLFSRSRRQTISPGQNVTFGTYFLSVYGTAERVWAQVSFEE